MRKTEDGLYLCGPKEIFRINFLLHVEESREIDELMHIAFI